MKYKLILMVALALCTTSIFAQSNRNTNCDFLKNLHFKNGVDTIIILANNKASVKLAPYENRVKEFYKEKNLNIKDFHFAVSFKLLNCPEIFTVDCKDQDGFELANNNPDIVVQLRCVVFDKYFDSTIPYFIVDKIKIKN